MNSIDRQKLIEALRTGYFTYDGEIPSEDVLENIFKTLPPKEEFALRQRLSVGATSTFREIGKAYPIPVGSASARQRYERALLMLEYRLGRQAYYQYPTAWKDAEIRDLRLPSFIYSKLVEAGVTSYSQLEKMSDIDLSVILAKGQLDIIHQSLRSFRRDYGKEKET